MLHPDSLCLRFRISWLRISTSTLCLYSECRSTILLGRRAASNQSSDYKQLKQRYQPCLVFSFPPIDLLISFFSHSPIDTLPYQIQSRRACATLCAFVQGTEVHQDNLFLLLFLLLLLLLLPVLVLLPDTHEVERTLQCEGYTSYPHSASDAQRSPHRRSCRPPLARPWLFNTAAAARRTKADNTIKHKSKHADFYDRTLDSNTRCREREKDAHQLIRGRRDLESEITAPPPPPPPNDADADDGDATQ